MKVTIGPSFRRLKTSEAMIFKYDGTLEFSPYHMLPLESIPGQLNGTSVNEMHSCLERTI